MPLPEGFTWLMDIASDTLKISSDLGNQHTEQSKRLGDVLDNMVACLERIAANARKNDFQACIGSCEELAIYLENFAKIEGLPDLTGADKVDLLNSLASALKARRGFYIAGRLVESTKGRPTELALVSEIEVAAGRFRAASALIKGGDVVRVPDDHAVDKAKGSARRIVPAVVISVISIGTALLLRWILK